MNSLDYLFSFQRFGIKLGLENIQFLLQQLGNPHHAFPAIHVSGTNGKGSVVAFLHAALVEMGYKVGRFISPHLVDFSERIVINDDPITDDEIDVLVEGLRPVINDMSAASHLEHPTFFETVTAMSFQHFARNKVDLAVVEVGMGGRYDSTNIVRPCVTIINNVSMEHSDYLGDTLEKIAFEKAGIIKPGVEVVSAVQQPETRKVIDSRAGECGAKTYYLSEDFHSDPRLDTFPRQWVDYTSPWSALKDVEIMLPGEFQAKNAAVALMSLEILQQKGLIHFDEPTLRKGLVKAAWPARLEKLADSPLILLDSAHNPAAMVSSVQAVEQLFPGRRILLVVGMLKDKDVVSSLRALRKLGDTIVATEPAYERALPANELADTAQGIFDKIKCREPISDALRYAVPLAESEDMMILITGSLFNVAEVRAFMESKT
jgi:dihydrofolate synthase/folylpolyglutamate synthase